MKTPTVESAFRSEVKPKGEMKSRNCRRPSSVKKSHNSSIIHYFISRKASLSWFETTKGFAGPRGTSDGIARSPP